ncbi:hypothetical protein [Alienimonas chondri]|uniref:Uncharacterized protein n=1 Tax=Alienimonas chondri TaxID=2681879 RepID=A0ABX1V9M5_9PLAN|nr:hypothetical protein [Alienimonas chondri]NNJ24763.1 hypothetical protein [Alienimonas chondri]
MNAVLAAVVGPLLQIAAPLVSAYLWAEMQHDGVPKWIGALGAFVIGVAGLGIAGYFAVWLGVMPWKRAEAVHFISAAWLCFGLAVGRLFGGGAEDFYFTAYLVSLVSFLALLFL